MSSPDAPSVIFPLGTEARSGTYPEI